MRQQELAVFQINQLSPNQNKQNTTAYCIVLDRDPKQDYTSTFRPIFLLGRGGGGGGGQEELEGLLVPSAIAVTAIHSSKPNTDQYQFPFYFILGRQRTEYKLNGSNWE